MKKKNYLILLSIITVLFLLFTFYLTYKLLGKGFILPNNSDASVYSSNSTPTINALNKYPSKPTVINTPEPSVINTPITTDSSSIKEDNLTLSFGGDVLLDRGIANIIRQKGPSYIFSGVKSILSSSDISMVNLECPVSLRGTKAPNKQYTFRAKPEYLDSLTTSGIDIVTLANNHSLDFGIDALSDTFEYLDKKGLKYVGAGPDLIRASKPEYMLSNGYKVALLGSSHVIPVASWAAGKNKPGVATTYNPARLLSEISKAKNTADIVAVYIHWGTELKNTPDAYQRNLAKKYIDSGADLVIGSHPHVLQGFEYYKGKLIAYSLGNFVFTNGRTDTMIVNIDFNDKGSYATRITPCRIENMRPVVISDKRQQIDLFKKLQGISYGASIDENGLVSE